MSKKSKFCRREDTVDILCQSQYIHDAKSCLYPPKNVFPKGGKHYKWLLAWENGVDKQNRNAFFFCLFSFKNYPFLHKIHLNFVSCIVGSLDLTGGLESAQPVDAFWQIFSVQDLSVKDSHGNLELVKILRELVKIPIYTDG